MPNEIYHRSEWGNPKAEGFGDVYFDPAATNKLYNHSDYYENSDGTDKILRDIPNKASIVLTPTAYSDGSLNTVIPPYQVLPQELVTNGTFHTDSDWTKETGWTISDGVASHNGVAGAIYQINNSIISGKTYKISLTVLNVTSGTLTPFIAGTNSNLSITQNGSYSAIVVAGSGSRSIDMYSDATFAGSIDNISIKEVQEADFDFSRGSSATRVNEKGLIEDVASGIPRIDYTSGQGALLLEPQRQNRIPYSQDFSEWSIVRATLEADAITSPDGGLTYKLKESTDTGSHPLYFQGITVSASASHTMSVFVKSAGRSIFRFVSVNSSVSQAYFDLTTQEVTSGTGSIEDYGNGWYRCSMNFTTTGTNQEVYIEPVISGTTQSYTGDGVSGLYVYGAQLEEGSYPTSYIPTNGSSVTRSADVANNSGNADLFNDSEGVLYAEIAALADDGTSRRISLSNGSTSNTIEILFQNSGTVSFQVKSGNSFQGGGTFNLTQTEFNKIAVKYKANDLALWVNGSERSADNSANTPIGISELAFDDGGGGSDFYGKVKALAVFKEALTDAELESLTSWTSFNEMATEQLYTIE